MDSTKGINRQFWHEWIAVFRLHSGIHFLYANGHNLPFPREVQTASWGPPNVLFDGRPEVTCKYIRTRVCAYLRMYVCTYVCIFLALLNCVFWFAYVILNVQRMKNMTCRECRKKDRGLTKNVIPAFCTLQLETTQTNQRYRTSEQKPTPRNSVKQAAHTYK
jgi:hypothetical protein